MAVLADSRTIAIPPDASPAEKFAALARLKRSIVGSNAVKAAAIANGALGPLIQILATDLQSTSSPDDFSTLVALKTEAASILASLSIPSLPAVTALLAERAYEKLAQGTHAIILVAHSDRYQQAPLNKLVEAHLRALKALYGDLTKVVGPREWGTEVIGASIDAVERRDAESLWTMVAAERAQTPGDKGKGKGKEGEAPPTGLDGLDTTRLQHLQAEAEAILLGVFAQPNTDRSSGTSAGVFDRSPFLDSLLNDILIFYTSPEGAAALLETDRMRSLEHVCSFFSGVVRSPLQRAAVAGGSEGAKALMALQGLVSQGAPDKVVESALRAMTVLARDSREATLALTSSAGPQHLGYRLPLDPGLLQSPTPSIRLAACSLYSVLSKQLAKHMGVNHRDSEVGGVIASTLLSLIKHEPPLRARAAFAFAYHVADDPEVQQRAIAAHCFCTFRPLLEQTLMTDSPYPTPAALEEHGRVREGLLLATATLCATSEPSRRAVLKAQLLPLILDSFVHPFVGVRAAACHCIRALSRSVSVLRTDMVESEAQGLLVWLLREEENEVVKVTATAAVANLLLEFSPLRQALVEAGCVPRMCQLILKSSSEALRLNAMWAIKNATYQSTADFKRSVLENLPWESLASLIASPQPAIAEVALGILRNITCVTNNEAITGLRDDELGEERLLDLLEERITGTPGRSDAFSSEGRTAELGDGSGRKAPGWSEPCAVEALYCLNNIATAHEAAQLEIASRTVILRYLLFYLDRGSLPLRVASLWVLHNLVYRRTGAPLASSNGHGNGSTSGYAAGRRGSWRGAPREVVEKLRAMGIEARLRTLERDPELDVRERVRDLTEALAIS
ncbi:hypothetical protein JCM8202v2_000891 [Rhodotorula sphaerocarpa]